MKDKKETRIVFRAITSYSGHEEINHQTCVFTSVIHLTLGSQVLTLYYIDKKTRDEDRIMLDSKFDELEK